MILGTLLRSAGYLLDLGAYLLIFLLVFEWLVHSLPGAGLNPLRRTLFKVVFPMLQFSDRNFFMGLGHWNARGLLLAVALWIIAKGLVPWIIWAGFTLKG